MPIANILSVRPPCLNDEKNEGPTCNPMQNTNSINPKSFMKCKVFGSMWNPRLPAKMPTNKTQVIPNEIPRILNLPKNVEGNYNLKLASVNLRRDLKNDLNSVIQELKDIILGVDNARN